MRTTLNLDSDVSAQLAAMARRQARSLSRVANDVLRAGLRAEQAPADIPPYEPQVFDTGQPRVDVTDVAAALEAIESRG